ncbi:hypothetical protein GCM10023085_27780 [Actinomadura viridis]|uniref:DUF3592 domain-containing protein n=1 Tax=Actinomadura viridis TaxID=58110 RepID=A0A931DGT5_9ACTN|nr:DUF3592 domain-containing protein [Actinomadura viridis]MBG6087236.1 hypothetical protein [Actinomadura viridis]
MIGQIVGSLVALAFVGGGLLETADRLRLQRRARRARGVFVAREDVLHPGGPAVRTRAARFRFTTENGQVVERVSALTSFPGPKPGRSVDVVYDPARPQATAERVRVHQALLLIGPLLAVAGVVLLIVIWTGR